MSEWKTQYWIDDENVKDMDFHSYWGEEANEKGKEWNILNDDFSKMELYIKKNGFKKDITDCINLLKKNHGISLHGKGVDLAAGNLWAVPLLFKYGEIEKLYCLEYSAHRLLKLGPKVLDNYNAPKEKVELVYGSFYDIKLEDNSLDFVFLSAAFHHAAEPLKLLDEIDRVLKPGGVVLILGEHILPRSVLVKNTAKGLINMFILPVLQKKIFGKVFENVKIFPDHSKPILKDAILGDHIYSDRGYRLIFSNYKLNMDNFKNYSTGFQSFILYKAE